MVVGTDDARIRQEAHRILDGQGKTGRAPALWDGKTSERIVSAVIGFLAKR